MDRKASEARKKLMDWDNRKDRGTKGYEEGSDMFRKHLREEAGEIVVKKGE